MNLTTLIHERKKQHLAMEDCDGFATCPRKDQLTTRVASKKEWLGTEKGRQEALRWQRKMDKSIRCEFCDMCDEMIKLVRKKK